MSRDVIIRRRQVAILVIAAVALVIGVAVGSGGSSSPSSSESTTASTPQDAPPECPAEIADDDRRLVGQLLMARMEGEASDVLRERVRDGELGGVIVFPPEGAESQAVGDQIAGLRKVAEKAGTPAPLVATDQEGGEVKRFADLPPDQGAPELGSASASAAKDAGVATGQALRGLGIDVDLAPVLDVPSIDGSFIESRAFSNDPAVVADQGVAFGEGLQQAGVAATAKHFPGLGLAVANTDLEPSPIDASKRELQAGLEPFEAAIDAGFGLVMVSNAFYPALDPDHAASQSPKVIDGLLRDQLGFQGVVITDDLGAGAITGAGVDEATAAIQGAQAGADLLLFALTDAEAAREALLEALRNGDVDRRGLVASCARITALRARLAAGPAPSA